MKLLTDISALQLAKSVVAVGSFDGIHLGHQKILSTLVDLGAREAVPAVVVTFHPHPALFFKRTENAYYITPRELQAELIAAAGVDYLLVLEFNQEFASRVLKSLVVTICLRVFPPVVIRFRAGENRQEPSTGLAAGNGFRIYPQVEPYGEPDFIQRIRDLLQKVRSINHTAARTIFLSAGTVNHGQKTGKLAAIANIYPEEHRSRHGVHHNRRQRQTLSIGDQHHPSDHGG